MTYRLTRKAAADIRRIYLESDRRFGTAQADRYHARLRRTFDLLAAYPELARERRELSPPLRVHPCGSHVILYAVDGAGDVLIVRIGTPTRTGRDRPSQNQRPGLISPRATSWALPS